MPPDGMDGAAARGAVFTSDLRGPRRQEAALLLHDIGVLTPMRTSSGKKINGAQNERRLGFFLEFLRHPMQIGSVIPSSRFLKRRVLEAAGIASARTVVELGPGTGGTTRAILKTMPQDGRLLSIEINPQFHAAVARIQDERLIAHLGSACDLRQTLERYGLGAPDAVVSGIPFSTMSRDVGSELITDIMSLLAPDGRFVAYQVSDRVAALSKPVVGPGQAVLELLNIPPMRIYRWEKAAVA